MTIKRREDSFWGIHTDFHARPEYGAIGATLKEEEIRDICHNLKPDYWQIDCKGHPGWASYPSEIGNAMPEIVCDTLALWRKVTREEGVALYMHYSGIWDMKYGIEHPEDLVLNAEGAREPNAIRPSSKYVDELLIPQLCEIAERYEVDGFWIDGECWALRFDYSPETMAAFAEEYGVDLTLKKPVKPEDPYYYEFREFNREQFRKYLRHYIDTLHEKFPKLQITSNWMFSNQTPEPVTANVDYLSGDVSSCINAVNWARYSGRAIAQQGLPWDLMGWGIVGLKPGKLDFLQVHPEQLKQQASAVIALGGGFQEVYSQRMDGSPNMYCLRKLASVSAFMKEREEYCFRGTFIHQAAMIMSNYDRMHENLPVPFNGGNDLGKMGMLALLIDSGQSVEILSEHTLAERGHEYPFLIIPELIAGLAPETIQYYLDYAKNGGNLLLTGPNTLRIFSEAGVPFTVKKAEDEVFDVIRYYQGQTNPTDSQRYFTLDNVDFGAVFHPLEIVAENAEVIAETCYNWGDVRHPYAAIIPYGAGKIAVIGSDIGHDYIEETQYMHRVLIRTIAEKFYTPKARIESSMGLLEIVCLEKNGHLMLQMVNGNGNHRNSNTSTEDQIPPVLDIEISIALDKAPQQMLLQPGGHELAFEYTDGRAYVKVDRLDMHGVIEVIE